MLVDENDGDVSSPGELGEGLLDGAHGSFYERWPSDKSCFHHPC